MTVERETPTPSFPDTSFGASVSPNSISSNGIRPAPLPAADPETQPYSPVERWLHRVSTLLFVFVTAVAGVLLVILPWRTEWMDNHFLLGSPALRTFVANGFVRGICSGLGLLDIWIGFSAAINYTDRV